MRQTRRALSSQQQIEAATGLWRQFRRSPLFFHSKRIGFYLAQDGEIDPVFLAAGLRFSSRELMLPCVDPLGVNRLQFAPCTNQTFLRPNRFGIPEPAQKKKIKPISLDLVLLPLVAFDHSGNRLGMGGGFYDRTFAFRKNSKNLGPKLIGLAHGCQRVDSLQSTGRDIPLDGILTDQQFIDFRTFQESVGHSRPQR